jgi:hypothetical protein
VILRANIFNVAHHLDCKWRFSHFARAGTLPSAMDLFTEFYHQLEGLFIRNLEDVSIGWKPLLPFGLIGVLLEAVEIN